MIDYGVFQLACPPFTGSTWCIKAAAEAGLSALGKAGLHIPHPGGRNSVLRVSTVRHPYEWIQSYWLHGGHIGVPLIDNPLLPIASRSCSFEDFIRNVIKVCPGQVGRIMFAYGADSYIRTDELSEAFPELLEAVGANNPDAARALPPQNVTFKAKPKLPGTLIDKFMVTEDDYARYFQF